MSNDNETDFQKIEKREQETLKEIQNVLKEITKKYPSITKQEAGFVRARVDYLTDKQAKLFAELFESKKTKVDKENKESQA